MVVHTCQWTHLENWAVSYQTTAEMAVGTSHMVSPKSKQYWFHHVPECFFTTWYGKLWPRFSDLLQVHWQFKFIRLKLQVKENLKTTQVLAKAISSLYFMCLDSRCNDIHQPSPKGDGLPSQSIYRPMQVVRKNNTDGSRQSAAAAALKTEEVRLKLFRNTKYWK